ncbi:imidazole glycerol phosphate synthase subunit HisH [Sphingorhabdus lutea]|uniref:Imidazole glycerol phosphate synthase subunit HisH n=1 Tax=Sphingorhabdus lutea TaxID=1913578 RepID=A0A1L3JB10_9SPHN|nr:imidazole glycerol phosphate synthase subunit HisH [Sphingorhabdus lutea]APG62299.1 imidazole glycerol phosphate synthase subunit HisH [Sphingorhabdus lutea]
MMIALIDYGAGNLHSVRSALVKAGADNVHITSNVDDVARADKIVLPGVGAFGACASALRALDGMEDALNQRVLHGGVPFLGICVGMQLLADEGLEFGGAKGLGWIEGKVRELDGDARGVKVPHMGWNDVILSTQNGLIQSGEAYFLHSFHFDAENPAHIIATTDHGGPLVAAVGRDNILGVQFHPEKSQHYGIEFLSRFLEWTA